MTFAWIAVPTLVCASGEPRGSSTWGVTERRVVGVKLTAAAASAGVPVASTVPICPKDRLNGAVPAVVNVSPRMGDANAEPASGPAWKTAGSGWSPSRDATATSPRSRSGSSMTRCLTRGPLPSLLRVREGSARPRSAAGLGLIASRLMREVAVPEPREATVVDMLASCAVASRGGIRAYNTDAAATTPIRRFGKVMSGYVQES